MCDNQLKMNEFKFLKNSKFWKKRCLVLYKGKHLIISHTKIISIKKTGSKSKMTTLRTMFYAIGIVQKKCEIFLEFHVWKIYHGKFFAWRLIFTIPFKKQASNIVGNDILRKLLRKIQLMHAHSKTSSIFGVLDIDKFFGFDFVLVF